MNTLGKVAAGFTALFQSDPTYIAPKKDGVTRVIAVGDSITEGALASDRSKYSWPAQLQSMVHTDDIEVINLGVGGRTMMKTGDFPYWNEPDY